MDVERTYSSAADKLGTSSTPFGGDLKKNLVRIDTYFDLNPTDPFYYQKLIRYSKGKSPEARYRLALRLEQSGWKDEAVLLYRQTAASASASLRGRAANAVRRLQSNPTAAGFLAPRAHSSNSSHPGKMDRIIKSVLICLFLFGTLLLLLYFYQDILNAAVTSARAVGTGLDLSASNPPLAVQAMAAYHEPPGTDDNHQEATPRSEPSAQLNALLLANGTIHAASHNHNGQERRMQNARTPGMNLDAVGQGGSAALPLTQAAANLVRTALCNYIEETGNPPANVEQLTADHPHNYLSFITVEPQSGSNRVVSRFDGAGGWVYQPNAQSIRRCLHPTSHTAALA
ncbi:hypothetical protein [Paenibacillus xerothermodurans]|uniref:Uncharacterized protein n=1 Tax=Paenibacillus xerothermodurans TaxID=1977292 RepID=A0A2W1NZZ8_PAEXE|nr:hypothetical protein [Paenibacillus xerothermodurans]PZE20458.1 hypothetical protein CBW46_013575 [Paenibacillus xerothermodurans]